MFIELGRIKNAVVWGIAALACPLGAPACATSDEADASTTGVSANAEEDASVVDSPGVVLFRDGSPADAGPSLDAFFATDPPPASCGDSSTITPPNPGGT